MAVKWELFKIIFKGEEEELRGLVYKQLLI